MKHGRITSSPDAPQGRTRYQGREGVDPVALTLVLAITLPLLAAMIFYKSYVEPARLTTKMAVHNVNLTPPSAPKPPPPPDTPPPPVTKLPPPILPPLSKAPVIVAEIDPSPAPVPAPVAAPAPPAPATPPAPPAPPATVDGGDMSASMIHAPPPRYPRESRRLREEGTVVLSVLLGVDGTVAEIRVARSSGHRRLDDAALSAVRRWRWRPTMRNGVAVQQRGTVPIPFNLVGVTRE